MMHADWPGLVDGLVGPPFMSALYFMTFDRRFGRNWFLPRWLLMAAISAMFAPLPAVHVAPLSWVLGGAQNWWEFIGSVASMIVALLISWWRRKKDRWARMKAAGMRELAIIAKMVRDLRQLPPRPVLRPA